jgi:trehalose-phosphatase
MINASHLFVFSDFDGTLAPIVDRPNNAQMPSETRSTLTKLARRRATTVAVISGRSLSDVKNRVNIPELIYAGNHGLEILGHDLHYINSTALACQDRLAALSSELEYRIREIPGVMIENKTFSVAIHTRHVASRDMQKLLDGLLFSLSDFLPYFELTAGIMVFEVRPHVDWNKGHAAKWIMDRVNSPRPLTIFLGDDVTDEDGFRQFPNGFNICVGHRSKTLANYSLADPADVAHFLKWLSDFDGSRH